MAYIIKNTSGLINTRVTDTGRFKIAQGNFNIAYFQIGDSEICYNCTTGSSYNIVNNNILEPCFNSQNSVGVPSSNKQNIKYPYYTDNVGGSTYGIPFNNAKPESVYNAASLRGFFTGTTGSYDRALSSAYTLNADFTIDVSTLNPSTNTITITSGNTCGVTFTGTPSVGDFVTIFFDGGLSCLNTTSLYQTLTYRITGVTPSGFDFIIGLDRNVPDLSTLSPADGRIFIYPSGMTVLYDTYTPSPHWYDDVIDFESVCTTDAFNVLIWNMNIPWTESPAGINPVTNVDYRGFGSVSYIGTKEYLGYNSISGQTVLNTGSTLQPNAYYYNSFDEQINVTPDEQKSIAIVHYTNNTIDFFYGEKFALEPYDSTNPVNTTGQARNFKISLPWLQWHKSPTAVSSGETFYVDPAGYDSLNLFQPYYILSSMNSDMNSPGIRYYNLWDNNPNTDGYPNRVGKVFPDQKIIIFDDDEIIAAMSYKSNRSWTLPAPKISLITPNACSGSTAGSIGIMSSDTEYMYVTYRFDNTVYSFDSLHCNYYQKISGPASGCSITPQNVTFRFGNEFPYMTNDINSLSGFSATDFKIICQKVSGTTRPDPTLWREIDFTTSLTFTSGLIDPSSLTGQTFTITDVDYNAAPIYDLSNYINLTAIGETGSTLNFGDEYYFYGTVETDIQATIYEMRYLCNLSQSEFQYSSNPTWTSGTTSYITEIGLYNTDKDLLVISKLQSPIQRQGVQQLLVKFDF
jgi:hypothetical protein